MAQYPALQRQHLIKDYISGIYRSKNQIIEYLLEKDIKIDKRTLTRDFNDLRDLNYDVIYVPGRGHIIKHSEEFENELLNRINTVTKLNKIMGKETALSEFVLDNSKEVVGIDLIPVLFKGLQEQRYVEFDYKKHTEIKSSHRKVIPLWFKEDKDFWYLIALPDETSEIRTFGLDRIQNLELGRKYNPSLINQMVLDQVEELNYRLGVSYPTFLENPKRELIELEVSDFLLPYWKSKPIHPTQRITNEKNDGFTKVTFVLIPNIDLIKLIVSGLGDIKLIGPKALRIFIQKKYKGLMKDIF